MKALALMTWRVEQEIELGIASKSSYFQNQFQLYWFQILNANAYEPFENDHDLLHAACMVRGEGAGGGE